MIEEFIEGREITVGVLGNQALPVVEIRSKNGFYDYEAKYLDDETQFLFDTIEDNELVRKIEKAATASFEALGCRHFARADFIIDEMKNPYILEVNTIPGFTSHSLLPMAAAKAGISMSELCFRIVEAALTNEMGEVFVNPPVNG
jgi:D-alanine-D-alanine ligase